MQRATIPIAAVVLPLPLPVCTTSKPPSLVLVANNLSFAALCLRRFSLARPFISSSDKSSVIQGPLNFGP